MNNGEVLTIAEVSQRLGCSKNLIYKLARAQKIHGFIRVGDLWYISSENFTKYINGESQPVGVK